MATAGYSEPRQSTAGNQVLFWGCFIALVTTAFGFISRMFLLDTWGTEFALDDVQKGRLAGIGIWPFAVSIIGFSLIIDKIGYKMSMIISFLGYIIWSGLGTGAYFISKNGNKETAFQMLYWGSLILGLTNGTIEAFINPVVATLFNKDKTKWLNILHAGWPGGLVLAGILTIQLAEVEWWIKIGIIAIPAVIYFIMLLPCRFPVQERVSSGVSYREMLGEFGILSAAIVGFLITLQLIDFFSIQGKIDPTLKYLFIGVGAAFALGIGAYTVSLGRFLMFFLVLIMMPLATTEIGTDGWSTDIMREIAKENKFHPGWVLVYTSAIMMVLRFFAGPIIHNLSSLGVLTLSAVLAIVGLATLSFTTGLWIFAAATLYGIGKTFFWPTMLGVVSEQMPKGGAFTLNAISGIGMLAVGTLGFPYIGTLKAKKEIVAVTADPVAKTVPGLLADGKMTVLKDAKVYEILEYQTIDDEKLTQLVDSLPEKDRETTTKQIKQARDKSNQGALLDMTIFPAVMLVGYILLMLYFKARGGYKPVDLPTGQAPAH